MEWKNRFVLWEADYKSKQCRIKKNIFKGFITCIKFSQHIVQYTRVLRRKWIIAVRIRTIQNMWNLCGFRRIYTAEEIFIAELYFFEIFPQKIWYPNFDVLFSELFQTYLSEHLEMEHETNEYKIIYIFMVIKLIMCNVHLFHLFFFYHRTHCWSYFTVTSFFDILKSK